MAVLPLFELQFDSCLLRVPPWVWFRRSRVTRGRVHFFLRGLACITSFRPPGLSGLYNPGQENSLARDHHHYHLVEVSQVQPPLQGTR